MSEASHRRWADPEYRKKMATASSKSIRKNWENPEFRKNVAAAASKRMKEFNKSELMRNVARREMARKKKNDQFENVRTQAASRAIEAYNIRKKSAEQKARWKSQKYRSEMAAIHSRQGIQKCSKIELQVCNALSRINCNYKRQFKIDLDPGYTLVDIFIPLMGLCVYVDGTYWHSLERTTKKDARINAVLPTLGFQVFRIRESFLDGDLALLLGKIHVG